MAIPVRRVRHRPFLPRLPLSPLRVLARLACLIHAANVHSEPIKPFNCCIQICRLRSPASLRPPECRGDDKNQTQKVRSVCFGNSESPGFDPTLRLDLNRFARPEGRTRLSGIYRSRPHPRSPSRDSCPPRSWLSFGYPTSPNSSIEHPTSPGTLVPRTHRAPSINEAHSNQMPKSCSRPRKVAGPPLCRPRPKCQCSRSRFCELCEKIVTTDRSPFQARTKRCYRHIGHRCLIRNSRDRPRGKHGVVRELGAPYGDGPCEAFRCWFPLQFCFIVQ